MLACLWESAHSNRCSPQAAALPAKAPRPSAGHPAGSEDARGLGEGCAREDAQGGRRGRGAPGAALGGGSGRESDWHSDWHADWPSVRSRVRTRARERTPRMYSIRVCVTSDGGHEVMAASAMGTVLKLLT